MSNYYPDDCCQTCGCLLTQCPECYREREECECDDAVAAHVAALDREEAEVAARVEAEEKAL